jgi:hypothetical protein
MTDSTRISSEDKKRFIEVVQTAPGVFSLRRYAVRYDPEEEVDYVIRVFPDPASKFDSSSAAVEEAERLIQTCS